MRTGLILTLIVLVSLAGDYLIKLASLRGSSLLSPVFLIGASLYATTAIGWFFLMRSHSLAAVGVLYSAATLLLLAGLGVAVFREPFGLREACGVGLALLAVVVIGGDH